MLTIPLIVVCDKGIARYRVHYSHKIRKAEFLAFKDATHCTHEEGYVDPHSPVSKKGYRIATTWYKEREHLFSIEFLREDELNGYHPNKEAAKIAKECYELFCIHHCRKKET